MFKLFGDQFVYDKNHTGPTFSIDPKLFPPSANCETSKFITGESATSTPRRPSDLVCHTLVYFSREA